MGEQAQKLMAKTVINALRNERWFIEEGNDDDRSNVEYHKVAAVLAAEVDKALGGLGLAWAAVLPDNSYFGPFHEAAEFSPGEARKHAEADVAEYEDAALKTRWVSGWSEVSDG